MHFKRTIWSPTKQTADLFGVGTDVVTLAPRNMSDDNEQTFPEYEKPPVIEVVAGIQFRTYKIHSGRLHESIRLAKRRTLMDGQFYFLS